MNNETINIQNIEELDTHIYKNTNLVDTTAIKINEIIKAVKQIDKYIKDKEHDEEYTKLGDE